MKIILLFALAAVAAATTTYSPENYYGYDFQPTSTYSNDQPFTSGLKTKLKSWADRFPAIKGMLSAKTEVLPVQLKKITNSGYTHYSQSASMQAVEGVEASKFDAFASYLTNTLEITGDKRDQFITSMNWIKVAENNDWSLVDIIFNQKDGANCKYACVLGHRDIQHNTYDFMIADFKTSFQLAPNLVLIEERKSYLWGLIQRSNTRIERIPASLNPQDIETMKMFFSQAALSRFARMLDIRVPGYDEPFVGPVSVMGMISAGLNIFQKVINLFKTTSTSTIIKSITGVGFKSFEQSARTNVIQGIAKADVVSTFLPMLPMAMQLSSDVFRGVEIAIKFCLMSDSNTWSDNKVLFSQDKASGNIVQFVDVVCNDRGDQKYNIILVNVAQGFALAPNIEYIENSKSYVGGIYSTTKIERKEYPRSLTDKDLEVLMGFFHITVFKRLATQYNLPIPPLPDKPEIKA